MSASLAHRLNGDGITPSVAGGKGAALDRLVALAAPVPPTGIVTTASYRAFVSDATIASFLASLQKSPLPAPAEHGASRSLVDEVFLSVELPAAVADAVDHVVAEVAGTALIAVRSSATAEDLDTASFAGQYESYLNVEPLNAHDAVRRVWASLWYPSPRSYRWFRGIDESDLTMAVVVMQMLDPSLAGVLFTVDPGGKPNAVRLEVVHGLGEQLVSGAVTPDAYVLDRGDLAASFAAIAPPLARLAREAMQLEDALGAPQDIEFAVHRDELLLVQARPITTSSRVNADDGFDFSCGIDTTYTTAGISESMPGVLPPLLWGVQSWLVENGFRSLFELLGGGAEALTHGHALIGRFNGRAALNLDVMRQAAGSIPGGSPEELEQQYFGSVVRTDADNRRADLALQRAGANRARQGVRVLRARRRAAADSEIAIQTVNQIVDREPDITAFDDRALIAYWNRLLHAAQQVAASEIAVAAMASASYRGVEVFLSRYMDSATAGEAARELTATDAAQRRARVALAVESIVAQLNADTELRNDATESWSEARAHLESTERGAALVEQMMSAWRSAGSTGVFAGPTWEEVPHLAWKVVYQELVRPSSPVRVTHREDRRIELERRLTRDAKWRATRWLTMQVLDVRRRFFRRQASEAAEFLDRREWTKAAYLQLGGVVRRCHNEFGRRLVARGRLEAIDDIELIGIQEITMLCDGIGPSLHAISVRRRLNVEANRSPALPLVWTGVPELRPADTVVGEEFDGWSASPGRYEGLARVVRSPDSTEFRRGEVLVATTTDASWTPLFTSAGAIVVEQGGPLSHAAIVARELGLPTVVNVPGFIARLEREGGSAPVVVDGTKGVVTIQCEKSTNETVEPPSSDSTPPLEVAIPRSDRAHAATASAHSAAYAPARVPDSRWDDATLPMNVFVAGLIGAGALMSTIVGLTESISSTEGRERLRRRATPTARSMAEAVVNGFDAAAASATSLRPRRDYVIAAAMMLVIGTAITARSTDLYFDGHGVLKWAFTVTGGITLLAVGSLAGTAALRWPSVPAVVRRFAPGYPRNPHSIWSVVPRRAQIAIAVMSTLVAVGAVFVAFALSWILKIDQPIYFDWLDADRTADRWGPDWFNQFGKVPLLIVIPVLVFVIMFARSRVIALAYPLTIAVGGAIFLTLNWTVNRLRPPFSAHAGEHTSYPGGHSIQLALVLLSLPLVVWALTRNSLIRVTGTIIAVGVWAITEIDTIRTGGHWPVDQTAGLLIAACLLTILYGVGLDAIRRESAETQTTRAECPRGART